MSLNWVSSIEPWGTYTACGECVIHTVRLSLQLMGDRFTEEQIATPEQALDFIDTLDEKDGAVRSRPVDVFFTPSPGARCVRCHTVVKESA